VFKAKPVVGSPAIGMDQQEARSYSFLKAIRELAEIKNGGKGLTGLEREAHEAESKRSGRTSSGVLVPYDVLSRGIEHPGQHDVDPVARILARRSAMAYAQRALTSGVFASGGAFVPELFTGSFIELLRARQVVMAMGATALGGLSGDVAIPRLDGGATAYWLGEGTAVTGSTQTTGQLTLKPKRVGANTDMSVTFVRQTAFDGEAMVRDDLARVIAIAIDKAAFDGDGGNGEPLGIVNVDGIGAVTFGAAATWAKVVEFESTTETNLAALGTLGYVTSPGSKGKWKTISKDTGSGQFLWDGGTVNGYRAEATTQVPSNRVFFGNWPDLIVASWDTLELVVDPFTRAINHEIRVVAHALVDVGLRHAKSMTVSSDAGNQ
jgi:HK97 family phage major capsid protein